MSSPPYPNHLMTGTGRSRTPAFRHPWLLPALAFVAVAIFCLEPAARLALWTDELYSLTTAEEDFAEIIRLCASAKTNYYDHPPLYFLLLHLVLYVSNSPLALRAISLICVALAAGLLGREVQRRLGFGPALAVVLLLVVHPSVSFQATSVRMYALYLLECVGIGILVFRLFEESPPRQARRQTLALALVIAAALYTVYFSVLLLLVIGMIGAAAAVFPRQFLQKERTTGILVLLAIGGGLLLYLPWMPVFVKVMTTAKGTHSEEIAASAKVLKLSRQLVATPAGAVLALAGAAGLAFASSAIRRTSLVAAAGICVTAAALALLTPARRDLEARYLLFAIPAGILIAVTGLTFAIRRLPVSGHLHACIGAIVLLLTVSSFSLHARRTHFAKLPDWWAAAQALERNALPHEVILTGGFLSGEAIVYHLKDPSRFSFIHYVTRYDEFRRWTTDPRVVWYVNAAPLPPEYAALKKAAFPYSQTYPGNQGLNQIELASKKPFR